MKNAKLLFIIIISFAVGFGASRFLLKKEDDTGILWDMPGGRVDENEWNMKEALERQKKQAG